MTDQGGPVRVAVGVGAFGEHIVVLRVAQRLATAGDGVAPALAQKH